MRRICYEQKVPIYHKIYEQIHENPLSTIYGIAERVGASRNTITKYLQEMHSLSFLIGPAITLKPAQNYHQYVYLIQFENPLLIYRYTEELSFILFRNLSVGNWNSLIITDKMMDFSLLHGFKQNFFYGAKGMSYFSAVTSLDWDVCLKAMYSAIASPVKKSSLYQEAPKSPWKNKEWNLFHIFKKNMRKKKKISTLQKHKIHHSSYGRWLGTIHQYCAIQTAFYPHSLDSYGAVDFLFESEYHQQLKDILGMLPSTGIFFSVGTHLLARLFYVNKKEKDELDTFILQLKEKGYFTNMYDAIVFSPVRENDDLIII